MKPSAFIGAILFSIAAIMLSGCTKNSTGGKRSGLPAQVVPVLAAKVVATNVPVRVSAIGNVKAYSTVTIRSQVTGQLRDVHFQEGQAVKQGDLLFTIDPRSFEAALEQAKADTARDEAQLQNLQLQFDREKKLFDQQVASQAEYDDAHAALTAQQALVMADRAAVTNATLNLEYTTIRSPIDGIVGAQKVYPGNIIKAEDDQMVMINQVHPIYVSFSVPEHYLAEIKREMRAAALPVAVTFQGMSGEPSVGQLTFIDNTVDPNTGTIQLKGTFTNEDNRLWPGQFVRVELTLKELPDVVVVPTQAIQTGQNGQYIYVVKDDQSVEERAVTIGTDYKGLTVVQDGLKAGETVVTDGQLRLVPGVKVSVSVTNSVANHREVAK